jgi:hypothetical protein
VLVLVSVLVLVAHVAGPRAYFQVLLRHFNATGFIPYIRKVLRSFIIRQARGVA